MSAALSEFGPVALSADVPRKQKYKLSELALMSGVCGATLRRAIYGGKLEAQRFGGQWLVDKDEALRFLKEGF